MLEKLVNSFKSVMVLFDFIFNDFRNTYTRISDDYDLIPLILFWIQLTVLVTAGDALLIPAIKSDSGEFSKIWFVFGSILQFVSAVFFAIYFHFFMKMSNFKGRFTKILKFTIAISILFGIVTLVFSFLGDLYLYSATDFFESMSSDHHPNDIVEYQIIDFIETYVLNVAFIALVASLFYVSVYRSKTTLLCLAAFAAIYALILQPNFSTIWTSYLCKRLDVCSPVESAKDPKKAFDLEAFDKAILNSRPLDH